MQTLSNKAAMLKAARKARDTASRTISYSSETVGKVQEVSAKALPSPEAMGRANAFAIKAMTPSFKAGRRTFRAAVPKVQSVREMRDGISKLITTVQKDPHKASPVFFGQHRKPQAVVLSYEVYEDLLEELEDAQIALRVKGILDAGGTESYKDIMSIVDLGTDA